MEKVPGVFGAGFFGEGSREGSRKPWCKAKSGSTGSVEGSGEGLGGFGAEPCQVQQGSGEGCGEGLGGWCRARSVQQGQVQQGSGEGSSDPQAKLLTMQ